MNQIIINYILKNFLKTIFVFVLVFYCFGVILNLFEEIEFFKNLNVSFVMPLMLTSIYIPSMIIVLLPFIVFLSSMWFMIKLRNNNDLLTLKVFGFSNLKIFLILATTSFILGLLVLLTVNPISSSMSKYYEKTKSNFSRDIDHLITFNKNGLWIKENYNGIKRIISAARTKDKNLENISIFHLDEKSILKEKIIAKQANIESNNWILTDVSVLKPQNGIIVEQKLDQFNISSSYNFKKINSLFKNFNTMSFIDLILNYEYLLNNGYNKTFLNESLHTMLSMPFFLFLMTALAAVFTMNTLKKSDNIRFIIIGLVTSLVIFYFKDLSLALGQTGKISLIFSVWAPVIALTFFIFIGGLQINEK